MARAKQAKPAKAKKPKKSDQKARVETQDEAPPPIRMGRPPKLEESDDTIRQIGICAQMQCTQAEAASFFGCCEDTFRDFIRSHKKAEDAWEQGFAKGRLSLRRQQFASAAKGNATMQIWLGKQWLGQRDKTDVAANVVLTEERSHAELTGAIQGKLARIATEAGSGTVPGVPEPGGA